MARPRHLSLSQQNVSTVAFLCLGHILLRSWGPSCALWTFSSTPECCSLDVNSTPFTPNRDNQKCLQTLSQEGETATT